MKLLLFLILLTTTSYALPPTQTFSSAITELEKDFLIDKKYISNPDPKGKISNELVKNILNDYKSKVNNHFHIRKYFKANTLFWFRIYTQFASTQVLIHDQDHLNVIYNVIDFDNIKKKKVGQFAVSKLQISRAKEYSHNIKKNLVAMATKMSKDYNEKQKKIYNILLKAKIDIPIKYEKRKAFFLERSRRVRTQTGQRDMIYSGIQRATPYLPYLYTQLDNFKIPRELVAIAFLESSFNLKALSKVAAAGIWQFMPFIGNLLMPKRNKHLDYRIGPIVSSLAAMHLLKENFQILKRWDLAITAYNSGTKHLVKARRQLKVKKPTLEYVLQNYETKHIGFASENFYAAFLALAHMLDYVEEIFPKVKTDKSIRRFRDETKLGVYLTKCSFTPDKFFSALKKSSPKIKELNAQFLSKKKSFPRGTIVVSDVKLTDKKYQRLTNYQLRSKFPKKFHHHQSRKKCNQI